VYRRSAELCRLQNIQPRRALTLARPQIRHTVGHRLFKLFSAIDLVVKSFVFGAARGDLLQLFLLCRDIAAQVVDLPLAGLKLLFRRMQFGGAADAALNGNLRVELGDAIREASGFRIQRQLLRCEAAPQIGQLFAQIGGFLFQRRNRRISLPGIGRTRAGDALQRR